MVEKCEMDRRSWLWRRKSSADKGSPGESRETESSGSVSSHSERYSDEQEVVRASSIHASPNHAQSPEVLSKTAGGEGDETVKSLNEKLSAALSTIRSKEDLVRQHAKVAEEAVLGWEKAEKEIAALKQQLEAADKKNSALEDRVNHLDGALKECVRQLWQLREKQEQKVQEALVEKTKEWESGKFELESRVTELQAQLEARTEASASITQDLQSKLEVLEKENSALRVELLVCSEDLEMQMLEKELSSKAAEAASKQHLESIKKIVKLEAECRKLRATARKSSSFHSLKPWSNSVCMESLTDSQSDNGERLLSLDNEPSCSDSWASGLIAEFDQFKNEKTTRKLTSSIEIDLMDDFLEMEKLAAMPGINHGTSSFEHKADSDRTDNKDGLSRSELEAVRKQMAELEEKVEKMATEKAELEMALDELQYQLKISCDQLPVAQDKLVELQRLLNLAYGEKHVLEIELEAAEAKRSELEFQLESANMEVGKLQEKVSLLEGELVQEKALSAEFAARCQNTEAIEANRKEVEFQLNQSRIETSQLQEKVRLLEGKVEEEKASSEKLASRCQNMDYLEAKKKELESQLEAGYMETGELHKKIGTLERKVEEERAISADLLAKCQSLNTMDEKRMELESQLKSAHMEVAKLKATVSSLEGKVEEERALSAEFAANVEAVDAKRKASVAQLESANAEIGRLREMLGLLEKQVQEEKVLSQEFAAKCHDLEVELSRKKQEAVLQLLVSSHGDLKTEQAKDRAVAAYKLAECQKVAAGKLAECQKTIASLNQQLKSFPLLDDLMPGLEEPELDGGSLCLGTGDYKTLLRPFDFPENSTCSSLCSGKESLSRPSSSSYAISEVAETAS